MPNCVLLLDTALCSLVLDNAISNAFRHGTGPASGVHLAVTTTPTGDDRVRLCFALTNQVSPTKPVLTPDFVARAWNGTHGTHGRQAPAHSPMSNGIGLHHAFLSANLHDMALHLTQHGTEARFTARVIASVAADPTPPRPADPGPFPPDLHVCVIDDSDANRQLLEHHLRHRVTQNVHVFGESVRDVEPFMKRTMAVAHIAVLDQNLEYGPEENVLGTDLVRQLVAQQFTGLICMRSGNAAAEDVAFYLRCGAHCVFGKDVPLRRMINELKAAYLSHARQTGAVGSGAEVVSSSNAHARVGQAHGHCGTDAPSQHNGHPPMPGVPPSDSGGLLPPAAGSGGPGSRHGAVGSTADVASSSTDYPPMPGVPPSDRGGLLPPAAGSGGPGPRHGAVGWSAGVASSSTDHPPMPGVPPSDSGGLLPPAAGSGGPGSRHGAVGSTADVASSSTDYPPMPGVPPSDSGGLLPPAAGSGGPGPRHGAIGSSGDVASSSADHPPMPGVPPSDSGGLLPPAAGSGGPGPRHGAIGSSADVASSSTDHPPMPGVPPSDSGGLLPPAAGSGGPGPRHGAVGWSAGVASSSADHPPMPGVPPSDSGGLLFPSAAGSGGPSTRHGAIGSSADVASSSTDHPPMPSVPPSDSGGLLQRPVGADLAHGAVRLSADVASRSTDHPPMPGVPPSDSGGLLPPLAAGGGVPGPRHGAVGWSADVASRSTDHPPMPGVPPTDSGGLPPPPPPRPAAAYLAHATGPSGGVRTWPPVAPTTPRCLACHPVTAAASPRGR